MSQRKRGTSSLSEALADEHRSLGKRIADVRRLLDGAFSWDEARVALAELRTTLEAHFAMEETGGYLADVLAHAPERGLAVAKLEADHSRMRGTLAQLLAEALVARSRDELTKNTRAFLVTLGEHERQENELVQVTFSTDVAASD